MPYVTYFGRTTEVTEAYFLFAVEGAVAGGYVLAQGLFEGNNLGCVAITVRERGPTEETFGQLQMVLPQIQDSELRALIEGFHRAARSMVQLNDKLVGIVAGLVGLRPPQDSQDRQRLKRRLKKYDKMGPTWVSLASFQRVLAEGARIYRALIRGKRQMDERLAELRARLPAPAKERPEPDIAWRLMEGPVGIALWVSGWLSLRHAHGFPDVTGEWRALGEEALEGLRAAMPRIDDPVLRPAAEALYTDLERQVETGDFVLEEVARFVGLPVPQDDEGRKALWERLSQYEAAGPVWVQGPALERLRQEMLVSGLAAEENRRRIIARQGELRAEALAKEKRARAAAAGGEAPGPAGTPS